MKGRTVFGLRDPDLPRGLPDVFEERIRFRLAGQGDPDLARDALGRPEVGPVAVGQLYLEVVGPGVVFLQLRLREHELFLERVEGKLFADEGVEVAFFYINCWHSKIRRQGPVVRVQC